MHNIFQTESYFVYLCGVLIEILAARNCVQWLCYIQWLRLCLIF